MEGIDWIKLQEEEELGQGLMLPVSNVDILDGDVRVSDNGSNPIQSTFPQWSARSGVLTSWGEAGIDNSGNGLILDPGMAAGGTSDGLESLDCLLSASNSQTDTASLEDDGISMIFSDCKGLWNFNVVKPVPSLAAPLSDPGPDQANAIVNQCGLSPPGKDQDPDNTKRKRSGSQQGLANQQNLDFIHFTSENQACPKRPKPDRHPISSSNISFQQASSSASSGDEPDAEAIAQMKEMMYRAAAFRPVHFGAETVEKPKRKNVRISSDPQTVAARQRRERISERIRVLQKLVPGGSKMDTASMLDEAANYLKFLRSQVKALEALGPKIDQTVAAFPANPTLSFSPFVNYTFSLQQPQFSIQNQNPLNKSLS